jgi:hypothetical protein
VIDESRLVGCDAHIASTYSQKVFACCQKYTKAEDAKAVDRAAACCRTCVVAARAPHL